MKKIVIKKVIEAMLAAMKSVLKNCPEIWTEVEPIAKRYMTGAKNRWKFLFELWSNKEITLKGLLSRLKPETVILSAELEATKVIAGPLAQKMAKKAIDALVKNVIKTLNKS